MKNIFRDFFRKKRAIQPPTPAPIYGPGRSAGRSVTPAYGPPPTLYGPPAVFDRPPSIAIIPGRLTVLTGPEAGKSFPLYGIKTNYETVLIVGRRAFSHSFNPAVRRPNQLNINDPTNTMSRMQFDIIYELGNTYLRCRSFSNPTIVDGMPLENNQREILRSGSVVRAGYVELRYDV